MWGAPKSVGGGSEKCGGGGSEKSRFDKKGKNKLKLSCPIGHCLVQ